MQENYLAKWLNNELSGAELSEFEQSEAYATYQRILETTHTMEAPDFDVEQALMAVNNRRAQHDTKVIKLQPFKKFMRVAAAAIILVMGTYVYRSMLDEQVSTDYAETRELVLPDNSEVVLNADSQLSYDKKHWNEARNINLNGEAYFKVAKGKRFTVTTDQGLVAVLGTQFNVENREGIFGVTCFEGLVSVTFNGKETKLPAGNSFAVINGKILDTVSTNVDSPSWMNAESSFKSMPLKYVLAEFERQHNIKVETQNMDTDQLYTGSFSHADVNLALKSISVPSGIKFKLEGKKVLFYGENAN